MSASAIESPRNESVNQIGGAATELELRRVTKIYQGRSGPVHAVSNVSLSVNAGETLAMVGASGCGKTTLLRMMAGLIGVTEGVVLMDGKPVEGVPLDMAMLPQNYGQALLPWCNVLDNVLLPFRSSKRRHAQGRPPRRALEDRAMHYLERVGLGEFARSRPSELSGGMQQRVLLARALTTEAKLILMDEPFSALDAMTRLTSQDLVREVLGGDDRVAVVMVTHDVDEAVYMSNRVAVLSPRPGRLTQLVTVDLPDQRDQIVTKGSPEYLRLRGQLLTAILGNDTEERAVEHG